MQVNSLMIFTLLLAMMCQLGKRKNLDVYPDVLQNMRGPGRSCSDLKSVCYHVALCVVQARRTLPSWVNCKRERSVSWPERMASDGSTTACWRTGEGLEQGSDRVPYEYKCFPTLRPFLKNSLIPWKDVLWQRCSNLGKCVRIHRKACENLDLYFSDSGLGWSRRICIADKFSGGADAAGLETTLCRNWVPRQRKGPEGELAKECLMLIAWMSSPSLMIANRFSISFPFLLCLIPFIHFPPFLLPFFGFISISISNSQLLFLLFSLLLLCVLVPPLSFILSSLLNVTPRSLPQQ